MGEFKPLTMQRAIRADDNLTGTQKSLLVFAALRAQSHGPDAGHVKASLELLAKDASCSAKTAGRVFGVGQTHVLSYFRRVTRRTRQVHLWFRLTPDAESAVGEEADTAAGP